MNSKKTWTPDQREMLFRRAHGKIKLAQYLEKLSRFFVIPEKAGNLLGLEESDAIIKKTFSPLQEQKWVSNRQSDRLKLCEPHHFDETWHYRDEQKILLFIQSLLDKQDCYIYWYDDSHYCGLYQAKAGTAINLDYDFAKHKPDDIWLYAVNNQFKIHLEYYYDAILNQDEDGFVTCANFLECTYQLYQTK